MYLWKVGDLADDLGNGRVSQKEEFKYTLAFTLLGTLFMGVAAIGSGDVPAWLMATDLAAMLGISGAGIVYCYYRNHGSDNREFIVRFICLGLPVTVRVMAFGLVVGLVVGAVAGIILGSGTVQGSEAGVGPMVFINLGVGYVIHAIYFVYLGRWMVAAGDGVKEPAA